MTSSRSIPTQQITDFSEIAADFDDRVQRIGFAIVATVDSSTRPRSRVLQPVWETDGADPVGWLITSGKSPKVRHLRNNSHLSISYWDPAHEMVFVEATARVIEDPDEKRRVWDLFAAGEGVYGYDPHRFFPDGPSNPDYCCVRVTPSRIELSALADRAARRPRRIWQSVSPSVHG
jgi:general stress protein 26